MLKNPINNQLTEIKYDREQKSLLYIKTLYFISNTNSSLLYTYQAPSFYYNSTIYQLIMEQKIIKTKNHKLKNRKHKLLLYIKTLFVISSTHSSLLYTYQASSFYYNSTNYQIIMELCKQKIIKTKNNKFGKTKISISKINKL